MTTTNVRWRVRACACKCFSIWSQVVLVSQSVKAPRHAFSSLCIHFSLAFFLFFFALTFFFCDFFYSFSLRLLSWIYLFYFFNWNRAKDTIETDHEPFEEHINYRNKMRWIENIKIERQTKHSFRIRNLITNFCSQFRESKIDSKFLRIRYEAHRHKFERKKKTKCEKF